MSDTNSAYSAPTPSQKVRFHQRRSAEERRNWVKRYERSGQTLKQFCERHGLALSSFCLWKRQLSQASGTKTPFTSGTLVEVPLRAPVTTHGVDARNVVIHFPEGTRIEVATSTDITWLADLVRAVRELEQTA
jgi:transposase-like protein